MALTALPGLEMVREAWAKPLAVTLATRLKVMAFPGSPMSGKEEGGGKGARWDGGDRNKIYHRLQQYQGTKFVKNG